MSAPGLSIGPAAIRDIDQMIRQLHALRSQLASELLQDEDVRAARTAVLPAWQPIDGLRPARGVSGAGAAAIVAESIRAGTPVIVTDDEDGDDESCPRCDAVSWGQAPDGRLECTRCLWSEPAGAR